MKHLLFFRDVCIGLFWFVLVTLCFYSSKKVFTTYSVLLVVSVIIYLIIHYVKRNRIHHR